MLWWFVLSCRKNFAWMCWMGAQWRAWWDSSMCSSAALQKTPQTSRWPLPLSSTNSTEHHPSAAVVHCHHAATRTPVLGCHDRVWLPDDTRVVMTHVCHSVLSRGAKDCLRASRCCFQQRQTRQAPRTGASRPSRCTRRSTVRPGMRWKAPSPSSGRRRITASWR